jgi:hypothetical protein
VLGVEYENKPFTGEQEGHIRGIQHIFNRRDHSFSSSGLRSRVAQAETFKALKTKGESLSINPQDYIHIQTK